MVVQLGQSRGCRPHPNRNSVAQTSILAERSQDFMIRFSGYQRLVKRMTNEFPEPQRELSDVMNPVDLADASKIRFYFTWFSSGVSP